MSWPSVESTMNNVVMAWLTDGDLEQFATQGHVQVAGVVPDELLVRADEEIDGLIQTVAPSEGIVGEPGQQAWFPSRGRLPRCEDALRLSPALQIARELVAPNELGHAFDHIQV